MTDFDAQAADHSVQLLSVAGCNCEGCTRIRFARNTDLERERDEARSQVTALREALADAGVVIERMANGATRRECSPELDRVIAALDALAAVPAPEEGAAR